MTITEDQLETWSHQGSIVQSSSTYSIIKNALEATDSPYAKRNFRVFLQGSYGNDTNVWSESDVDIVILLNDCFQSDLSGLSPNDRRSYEQSFANATYNYPDFKRDVSSTLAKRFGGSINVGSKAISIAADGSRRKADVIVAIEYRRYYGFNSLQEQSYAEGICFWNSSGERIENFPRQHSANLTTKHQATGSRLKPLIRVFKNFRTRLVEQGYLRGGIAPSYYLEGLLYNMPNDRFVGDYRDKVASFFDWATNEASVGDMLCANEQYYLVRDGYHSCWPTADFEAFVDAAYRLWSSKRPWVRLV